MLCITKHMSICKCQCCHRRKVAIYVTRYTAKKEKKRNTLLSYVIHKEALLLPKKEVISVTSYFTLWPEIWFSESLLYKPKITILWRSYFSSHNFSLPNPYFKCWLNNIASHKCAGTLLLIQGSQDRVPAATAAFRWRSVEHDDKPHVVEISSVRHYISHN